MSAEARPISSAQFALAIQDLPVENLYAKAQEIENSISHLSRSNRQLQEYSDSIRNDTTISGETREEVGDKECLEAIAENEKVIERQRERVDLLKAEAERRGRSWHGAEKVNGDAGGEGGAGSGGRLTDEELRRQMGDRLGPDDDEGPDGGMHL